MSVIEKEEVLKVVQAAYGLSGKVSNLGSCQDINFKFTDAATGSEYVVKFTDAAMCTELEIDFQHAVITYLASCDCGDVAFPIPMVASSGSMVSDVTIGEKVYRVRMLKFVRGNILSDYKYFSAEVLKEFGAFVGMLTLKMTGFEGAMQAQTDLLKVANREIEW
jgi:Ser/Thr protein kinase RdoA (MazF antagonist)